jgi:AcrR family transcriptional regulator
MPGRKPNGATRTRKDASERREEILAAALRRFGADGFEATSMQRVAQEAGLATGTLYLYFPSKEHLLEALHTRFHDGLTASFAEIVQGLAERVQRDERLPVTEVIDAFVDAGAGYCRRQRDLLSVILRALPRVGTEHDGHAEDEAFDLALAALVEQAKEEGLVHTSDPLLTVRLLNRAVSEAIGHAVVFEDEAALTRVVAQAKELWRKALAPLPD